MIDAERLQKEYHEHTRHTKNLLRETSKQQREIDKMREELDKIKAAIRPSEQDDTRSGEA